MLYTHYCTVGKYSLINPSPLCVFLGGGFLARAIDQILSRVDLRFFLPPSLPITLSSPSQPSHLNVVSASPVIILRDLDFQFSFFYFSGRGTLHNTSILSTYTYNSIFRDAEKRESKKKKKEKNELPRVCRIRTKTYTHTYLPTYLHTYCWFQPPVRIQKSIVYLPTYLPRYLPNLANLPRPRQLP